MKNKTYFTEFVVALFFTLLFMGTSTYLFVTNHDSNEVKSEDTKTVKVTQKKSQDTTEEELIDHFVKSYFTYSSDNYKKRLPVLKELITDSYYKTLSTAFDDMFIEKGFESSLKDYTLFQSEKDHSTFFIEVTVTYVNQGKSQTEKQSAVIDVDFISNQPYVSGLKFIQRTEF